MATGKSAGGAGKMKQARDKKRSAYMKAKGVIRTTYRDPITYAIRAIGTYPGINAR